MIIRNSAKCNKCGDHIISHHVHDFVSCKCGAIFVDGGREYLRRGGELDDIEETSIACSKDEVVPHIVTMMQDFYDENEILEYRYKPYNKITKKKLYELFKNYLDFERDLYIILYRLMKEDNEVIKSGTDS